MTTQDIITAWNEGNVESSKLMEITGYDIFTIIQTLNSSIPGFRSNFIPSLDDYCFNLAINAILIDGIWYVH